MGYTWDAICRASTLLKLFVALLLDYKLPAENGWAFPATFQNL
jgi:hypothetical protein